MSGGGGGGGGVGGSGGGGEGGGGELAASYLPIDKYIDSIDLSMIQLGKGYSNHFHSLNRSDP